MTSLEGVAEGTTVPHKDLHAVEAKAAKVLVKSAPVIIVICGPLARLIVQHNLHAHRCYN